MPTQEMLDAVGQCPWPPGKEWVDNDNRSVWNLMIATAPQPEQAQQSDKDRLRFRSACEISGDKHPEYVRGYEAAMDAVCKAQPAPIPTSERLPTEAAFEWQPIESAPKGRIVLVHYYNVLGKSRTVRAAYYLADSLESEDTESGFADEGWYEEAEAYDNLAPVDGEPTHWMPLPPPPKEPSDERD